MDDCTNAGNVPGSGITMVDLYRMNPGLVCDPAKGLKGDASGSMKVEVCVDAEYDDYSMGKCSGGGKLKYFKADTPCVSLLAREFKGKRADFRALNKRECATTIGGSLKSMWLYAYPLSSQVIFAMFVVFVIVDLMFMTSQ
ncbi:hypothetical protein CLOM_g23096 [Closterium sp. NIES-68]|nr:hypothetical protein CLOM_g23096 [Closterium sp. NIES-68]